MLIRLGSPSNVSLAVVASWAEENRIPVVYREVLTIWRPAPAPVDLQYGFVFSRHSMKKLKAYPLVYATVRFHILTRPQDELLLVVRFGLERVNAP